MREFQTKSEDDVKCFRYRDYSILMHSHDFYEINLVCGGEGYHYFGGKRFPISTGDYFVIPPNLAHGYVSTNSLYVLHLIISTRFIEKNIRLFYNNNAFYSLFMFNPALKKYYESDLKLTLKKEDYAELQGYAENISRWQDDTSPESISIVNANALSFLFLSFRCYLESNCNSHSDNAYHTSIRAVMNYIFEHYSEKTDSDTLADIAGYSRSNFYKFFKKMTSMTPNDFINQYRVYVAQEMIVKGDKTLTEIAADCGFYDAAHFSRLFKKFTGSTPGKTKKTNS